jgi:nitrogen regulatory protein P-II 1
VRRSFGECCRKGPARTPRADNENLFHASPPWHRCVAPFPGSGAFGRNDYELRDRIACEGEVEAKLGWLIREVKVSGRHADHAPISGGGEYFSEFMPKLKFEIVVADSRVRRTILAIVGKARTGRINDGRVFVVPIQEAIRIRTGQRGEAAV